MAHYSAKFTTILPLTDNDGKDQTTIVEQIEQEICVITGGATIQVVSGIWYEDGVRYSDNSHKVETAIIETGIYLVANKVDQLKTLATAWGHRLGQLAMYTEIEWNDIEIINTSVESTTEDVQEVA